MANEREKNRQARKSELQAAETARKQKINDLMDKAIDSGDPIYMQMVADSFRNDPLAKSLAADRLRSETVNKNLSKYVPLLQSIVTGAGVAASLSQINSARLARRGLVRPSIPSAPPIDAGLNQQIYQAQLGSMDAGRRRSAAEVGINDAYNQQVQEATNTAGGQAGTRQALINKAALNKMRAHIALTPELDAIRAREEGRADTLIGHRAQLAQNAYGQQLQATGMGLDQYNRDAQAIGALGAIGHENLFSQLQGMPSNLVAGFSSFSNPYTPTPLEVPEDKSTLSKADQYEQSLNNDLYAHTLTNGLQKIRY